jgi:hypothetical protein
LNKYIQRSYEKCKSEFDIQKCKVKLTKIINAAIQKGDMNTRDWNKFPLPDLPSDEDNIVNIVSNDTIKNIASKIK